MPAFNNYNVTSGPSHTPGPRNPVGFNFGETPIFEYPYSISGVTKDSTGAALGGVAVHQFDNSMDSLVSVVVSDANGNYITPASPTTTYYLVAYKAGSPDVTGATLNTLKGI